MKALNYNGERVTTGRTYGGEKVVKAKSYAGEVIPFEDEILVTLAADDAWWSFEEEPEKGHPNYCGYSDATKAKGVANAKALNDAIAAAPAGATLKIAAAGKYPITFAGNDITYVNLKDVKLDLNGATLYTAEEYHQGSMFRMRGDAPEIYNGRLSGSYDHDTTDYRELESLIDARGYEYNTCKIHDLELMNAWGYAIKDQGWPSIDCPVGYMQPADGRSIWRVNPFTPEGTYGYYMEFDKNENYGTNTYVAAFKQAFVSGNYKYLAGIGGVGYNYILSDEPFKYEFYGDGTLLSSVTATPRVPVEIPTGATKFRIYILAKYGTYPNGKSSAPDFKIGLFNYSCDKLTIENCKFHHDFALGVCGGSVRTLIKDCESWGNGKPFSDSPDSTHFKTGTVGFCDVEDLQTPYIEFENVNSHDEKSLLMDGSYEAKVKNCHGLVWMYRGWNMTAENHTGDVRWMSADLYKTLTFDGENNNLNIVNNDNTTVIAKNMTVNSDRVVKCMDTTAWKYDNADITVPAYTVNSYYWLGCAPNCKLTCVNMGGSFRLLMNMIETNPYTGKPTRLEFHQTMDAAYAARCGVIAAYQGDLWGLDSDTMFFANGYTVHNSKFAIKDVKTYEQPVAEACVTPLSGTYDNCEFDIDSQYPFRVSAKAAIPTTSIVAKFKDCTFTMAGSAKLYRMADGFNWSPNSVITFENCTINGKATSAMTDDEIRAFVTDSTSTNVTIAH